MENESTYIAVCYSLWEFGIPFSIGMFGRRKIWQPLFIVL
jgi:hypothetical protein